MKRIILTSLIFGALVSSVFSCRPATAPTSTPSAEIVPASGRAQTPTALEESTAATPPTKEPTAVPTSTSTPAPTATPVVTTRQVQYENVSFGYYKSLGINATGQTVAESSGPDLPEWELAPKHIRFSLEGYPVSGRAPEQALYVFPVEEYRAISPNGAGPRIDAVAELLAQKPDLKEIYPLYTPLGVPANPTGAYHQYRAFFPFLPPANAGRLITLKMEYLYFASGSGIRYLSEFVQDVEPVGTTKLFYSFQGLTSDGKYYVSAVFPVNANVLTTSAPDPTDLDALNSYNETLANSLEQSDSAVFSPNLRLLDSLVRSISVK